VNRSAIFVILSCLTPSSKSDKSRLPAVYLIDAMSFIFRAYHAMQRQRPMSTRTGIPTAATFVFVNMLNKLREDFAPEYLAAVFDVAGPTFRDTEAHALKAVQKYDPKTQQYQAVAYAGYKANRTEMPGDLAQQVPYIRRALEAYRIPILSHEGFEADDVIGTLASKAAAQGHPVYVVSSDKDMLQLVNDHICVLNPPKDNLICDAVKVEEILGVPPERVVDVMALRGDSIDNIPGAPGIGDKGSVELIKRFGSVEAALDHADEIERKSYRESLQRNRDVVLLSKRLVTIDCNVPVELDLEAMKAQPPDVTASRKLFSELEFTALLKTVLPGADEDLSKAEYTHITTKADLDRVLKQARGGTLALAFQTGGKQKSIEESPPEEDGVVDSPATGDLFAAQSAPEPPLRSNAIGLAVAAGSASTADLHSPIGESLRSALKDPALPKAVHDLKAALQNAEIAGVMHETMLYSYLLEPTQANHQLPAVALRRFSVQAADSVAQAADLTFRLSAVLREEVESQGLLKAYEEIDLPLVAVLKRMEDAGVSIDLAALSDLSTRLERACTAKAKEIHDLAGEVFNINSPKQLGQVLFEKLGLPKPVKYGKGKTVSTAVDVLEELAQTHAAPRLVLEYRQMSKLKSTYIDALPILIDPATKRLHTTFNQVGTATGRLSSNNPNLQNIPIRTELGREIRAAFVAEPGNVLLAADYSQIELRLLAHYSEDPLLTTAFRRGDDIHQLTASEVFNVPPMMIDSEHRRRAKAVNFGIVYGLSPFGLAQQLGIDQKEAKTYIEGYFAKYKGVRRFIDATLDQTRRDGFVRTLFGRLRPIPDINSKNANMRGFAERTAVNTPLQGTAADLIKLAMIRIDAELRQRRMRSRMTLQVHDELVFEVPEAEAEEMRTLVKSRMEEVYELSVPLVVDVGVGKNWRDLE
jgi:DNA polymerase-1